MVTSSIAASSSYYWQEYMGGSPGGSWTENCMPGAPCEWETVGPQGVPIHIPLAYASARAIIAGDIGAAALLWVGNGLSLKMVLRLGARLFISGGAGFAIATAAAAAIGSIAVAVS